jgi:uncharacterized membrane protein
LIAVAEQADRAPRRRLGVWIALALSLTLNVCLVGGLVWAMVAMEPPPAPAERFVAVGRNLDLDATQRAALAAFAMTARNATLSLRESNAPVMQKIWNEMAQAKPDEAAVSSLTDEALQNRRVYQGAMTTGLLKFLATLSPEQRSQFAQLAHHSAWNGRRGFHFPNP